MIWPRRRLLEYGQNLNGGGYKKVLCRSSRLVVQTSRLVHVQRVEQSTGGDRQSTDRPLETAERVLDGLELFGGTTWGLGNISLVFLTNMNTYRTSYRKKELV